MIVTIWLIVLVVWLIACLLVLVFLCRFGCLFAVFDCGCLLFVDVDWFIVVYFCFSVYCWLVLLAFNVNLITLCRLLICLVLLFVTLYITCFCFVLEMFCLWMIGCFAGCLLNSVVCCLFLLCWRLLICLILIVDGLLFCCIVCLGCMLLTLLIWVWFAARVVCCFC